MNQKIVVTISGGAVQDVEFPAGLKDVELEIRDYDNDDPSYPSVKQDEDGDFYQEMIFVSQGEGI